MSALEEELALQIKAEGLIEPKREYRFHPVRKWRFDFYWSDVMCQQGWFGGVACEVEGGTYIGGRHTRGASFEKDAEKYNEAALMGIMVLRVTGKQVKNGLAIEWLGRALCQKDFRQPTRQLDGPIEE